MNNIIELKMRPFINAVRNSIKEENWYAALTLALTLPDICGKLELENLKSAKRYIKWFNKYIKSKYTVYIGPDKTEKNFLTGEDAYALRCSYLHAGEFNIEEQYIRKALEGFMFVVTKNKNQIVHNNKLNNVLQLQVSVYCEDICDGVEQWINDNKDDEKILQKASRIQDIKYITNGFSI